MDLLNIGQGVDAFPAVEPDQLVLARRMLFGFCMNGMAIRMQCVYNQLRKPLKKRRRGLSAKTASRSRGRSYGRQRLGYPKTDGWRPISVDEAALIPTDMDSMIVNGTGLLGETT